MQTVPNHVFFNCINLLGGIHEICRSGHNLQIVVIHRKDLNVNAVEITLTWPCAVIIIHLSMAKVPPVGLSTGTRASGYSLTNG